MPELEAHELLQTETVTVREVVCRGNHPDPSGEERANETQLVFPYRGAFVRHLSGDDAVAEANQVMLFNANEGYRVSHPVPGGDASLTVSVPESLLAELAPGELVRGGACLAFRPHRLRIDARTQAVAALLRHRLRMGLAGTLEAESLGLALVRRALGRHTGQLAGATPGRRRLVDRIKLILAGDLARRWTLAQIAAEMRGSPVYLTQVFQQVEGVPLYRYQLRLRLARALDLLPRYDDLASLSLDLGFSSHSHFGAAFRAAYGRTPSEFRRAARRRRAVAASH
jgi:AraC-like DNA-binding protein